MTPAQEIERWFPGVTAWYGASTGHWWALVWCGQWRLVEALTSEELRRAVVGARAWPWPSAFANGPGRCAR